MSFVSAFANGPQLLTTVAAPVTAINATTLVTRSLTVTESTPDMTFCVTWPSIDAGLLLGQASCDVAGTVKLQVYNTTGAPITPAAATLHVIGL